MIINRGNWVSAYYMINLDTDGTPLEATTIKATNADGNIMEVPIEPMNIDYQDIKALHDNPDYDFTITEQE